MRDTVTPIPDGLLPEAARAEALLTYRCSIRDQLDEGIEDLF